MYSLKPLAVYTFFLYLFLCAGTPARAALSFDPAAPLVPSGGTIQLSVKGATEPVTWVTTKGDFGGQIFTSGLSASYSAPAVEQAEVAAIVVQDAANQIETLTLLIQPQADILDAFKPENARWKVYTNRKEINAFPACRTTRS